jgi:outer membrane immunogenic protein
MKTLAFAFLAATALTGSAYAADMPAVSAPMDVQVEGHDWSGFYVGGHVGYGVGEVEDGVFDSGGGPGPFALEELEPEGVVGGVHAGYNHQWGWFVAGLEADVTFGDLNDDLTSGVSSVSEEIELMASGRVRVGAAFDNLLVYGTVGAGYVEREFSQDYIAGDEPLESDDIGLVYGGGLEYAWNSWSFRAEGLYYDVDLDEDDLTSLGDGDAADFLDRGGVLVGRVGVSYNF